MGVAATWAEGTGGQPVIEQSTMNIAASLDARDMKRIAAGMVPRVRSFFSTSAEMRSGWFTYGCGECVDGSCHRSLPQLRLVTDCQVAFTAAEIVKPSDPQGARFVRAADGSIVQSASTKDCCFVSSAKDVIIVDRYHTCDCRTEADGLMKPQSDAERLAHFEIRDVTSGPGKETRKFEIRSTEKAADPQLMIDEFSERKGQSQSISVVYRGHEAKPEALKARAFFQRVNWPEGPGYRQIQKLETAEPGAEMKVILHVIENWRVAPDGSRKMVDRQELVAPKKPSEEGQPADSEEIY